MAEQSTEGLGVTWPERTWLRDLPFRLGTTSFVVPAGYVGNVKFVAGHVDDVELLFFESHDQGPLPPSEEIDELRRVAHDHHLSYTVHLPLDIALGAADHALRRRSVQRCLRVIELTASLKPHSYVVHFHPAPAQGDLPAWRAALHLSVQELLSAGIEPRRLCVETLDYPAAWFEDVVACHGLSLCLDVGHLFLTRPGQPLPSEAGGAPWRVVHVHGVRGGRDHRSLAEADSVQRAALEPVFRRLLEVPREAVVTIEVFALAALLESLPVLETIVPCRT
jgi:sugar phosphate isomerase/epimerase